MNIDNLLKDGREIWGEDKLTLEEIIIRLNVVVGDISRIARHKAETDNLDEVELQKELGNVIFSMIRWCDDVGYSPQDCILLAKQAQINYQSR